MSDYTNAYLYFTTGLMSSFYLFVGIIILVIYGRKRGHLHLAILSFYWCLLHLLTLPIYYFQLYSPEWDALYDSLDATAVPAIFLCLREIVQSGWLTIRRTFAVMLPFFLFLLCIAITGSRYLLYAEMIYLVVMSAFWLRSGCRTIDTHDRLIKSYVSDTERYNTYWVKVVLRLLMGATILWIGIIFINDFWLIYLWDYCTFLFWIVFLYKAIKQQYVGLMSIDRETLAASGRVYTDSFTELFEQQTDKAPATPSAGTKSEGAEEKTSAKQSPMVISDTTYQAIESKLNELMYERQYFLDPSISLVSLAGAVLTNRTYMSLYFQSKSISFWDYINKLRCDYAIEVMKAEPDISFPELAKRCGYKTEGRFRSSFQNFYNMTPVIYRKRCLVAAPDRCF